MYFVLLQWQIFFSFSKNKFSSLKFIYLVNKLSNKTSAKICQSMQAKHRMTTYIQRGESGWKRPMLTSFLNCRDLDN